MGGIAIFGLEQNDITCFDNELDTRRNTEGDNEGLGLNTGWDALKLDYTRKLQTRYFLYSRKLNPISLWLKHRVYTPWNSLRELTPRSVSTNKWYEGRNYVSSLTHSTLWRIYGLFFTAFWIVAEVMRREKDCVFTERIIHLQQKSHHIFRKHPRLVDYEPCNLTCLTYTN
jgi:hypothetical protein